MTAASDVTTVRRRCPSWSLVSVNEAERNTIRRRAAVWRDL